MKLHEAIKKMEPEDICRRSNIKPGFRSLDSGTLVFESDNKNRTFPFNSSDFTSESWEIIPEKPKAFTVEELMEKQHIPDEIKGDHQSVWNLRSICDTFDQNGQMKQWINHKKLREVAEFLVSRNDIADRITTSLKTAIENLNPLKPRSKDE